MQKGKEVLQQAPTHVFFHVILNVAGWFIFVTIPFFLDAVPNHYVRPAIFTAGFLFCGAILAAIKRISGRNVLSLSSLWNPTPLGDQIRVLRKNSEMHSEITTLLKKQALKSSKVIVVQYSARHCMETVNEIWENTNADIELFLGDPDKANTHQAVRINERLTKFDNDLIKTAQGAGLLEVFTYEAPASLRAILFDKEILYFGTYLYKKLTIDGKEIIDTRGGELPLFSISAHHPQFAILAESICETVDNWKKTKVAKLYLTRRKQNAYKSVAAP